MKLRLIGVNMLSPIPWERYSGETVESILATYICRLRPRATRIRPSQGDRGIDVVERFSDDTVVVYQIKKFANNLKKSHKRQIEDSSDTLLSNLKNSNFELREWHLVMPLDPTPENREWFYGLASDTSFDRVWDGLTTIDGWAAQMPEVADYCLNSNSGWVMELVRMHLEALDIQGDGGLNRVVQKLLAVQGILNRTDPYYRYGVNLIPESVDEMGIEKLMNVSECQPSLLMTQVYEQAGMGMVRIDVFARSAALAELHPIKGNISLLPRNEDERKQVEDFVNYGVPIRGCQARIVKTSGPFAFDTLEGDSIGDLSMLSHEDDQVTPELFLITGEGVELALFRTSRTSGERGVQTVFSDAARVVSVTIRADFEGGVTGIPEVTTAGIEGKDCSAICDSLGFLDIAYERGEASVLFGAKVFSTWTLHSNDDLAQSIKALYELACSVESIGRRARVQVPFPKIDGITESQHVAILSKAALASGEYVIRKWRHATFTKETSKEINFEFPIIIKWLSPETITIGGVECVLGYSENIIVAGALRQDVGDASLTFLPRDAGEDVCITHLLPTRSAAIGMVGQVFTTPYQEDAWINILRLADHNQIKIPR